MSHVAVFQSCGLFHRRPKIWNVYIYIGVYNVACNADEKVYALRLEYVLQVTCLIQGTVMGSESG